MGNKLEIYAENNHLCFSFQGERVSIRMKNSRTAANKVDVLRDFFEGYIDSIIDTVESVDVTLAEANDDLEQLANELDSLRTTLGLGDAGTRRTRSTADPVSGLALGATEYMRDVEEAFGPSADALVEFVDGPEPGDADFNDDSTGRQLIEYFPNPSETFDEREESMESTDSYAKNRDHRDARCSAELMREHVAQLGED